ncbi:MULTISPECIES: tyrosine-type recombinase/integrase [unclassified Roseateles]|uniref:tyrosine-type recombinase/integrase n=1 Tax=unclassified Roseateles TaxID=2626991 RepID=UPI0006F1EF68|nr:MULTISPECIES: tyrosine-type recombinase/integrase [unclassified Roseateles]KQW49536.1 integrase [Pelomonas sp. Root405]KRA75594.1 integrase [Pelomonas sp. Root662]
MNTLREALPEYLRLRRSLGFKLEDAGLQLPRFVAFVEAQGSTHITTALALAWAQQSASVQPAEWARRLGSVRCFARYRSATDALTEIPPSGLLPHRSTRARPYLYSDEEVQRLLNAALQLPTRWHSTPLRPWEFHCLFGLLSTTGMRISEALNLHVADVDLDQALLTIRGAKLGNTRLVPLHASTARVLADYLQRRQAFFARPISPYVFVSRTGNRLDMAHVHRTFYALSRQIGLRGPQASHGPRIHDLRHRFAVQVLTRWYQAGEDPARLLPVLSTYIGHVRVQDTYWYLSAWPELMTQAMQRLERRWEAAP